VHAKLIAMFTPESPLRAGAHCSGGWEIETPWHYHDVHQLLYAFEGAIEIEGRHGRYKVPHQYAVWISAGAVHRTSIHNVSSGSIFMGTEMVETSYDAPRVIAAPSLLREMVMYAMRWPLDRATDSISADYFQCFAGLCNDWIADEVKLVLPSSADPRIATIMDFTLERIPDATVADICRQAGMSERTLRRRFRRVTGITWEEYRLRLRIWLALDALERTTRSIGVIASEVGYEDQAAFARAFRSLMGISPSEYRSRSKSR
jgi:transcriptional regulator GlxA family with amidase domain